MAKRKKRNDSNALVLELKLGCALNMPTKRMSALLHSVAQDCNRVRNAVMRGWIRWREDNPNYEPGQRRDRSGKLKANAEGKPLLESPIMSQEQQAALYHTGRRSVPHLHANVASHCWSEACDRLKARMPYNHAGESRFVWQAILSFETSTPSWSRLAIPCPSANTVFGYCGAVTSGIDSERIGKLADDHAVLRIALFSREAGRKETALVVRCEVRQLSAGKRRLLRRVARGEMKLRDSKLVPKRDGWYFQLTTAMPAGEALPENVVASLEPQNSDARSPFVLYVPEDEDSFGVRLGFAQLLVAEHRRIEVRRKTIRFRSRGGKGHGKGSIYRKLRPYERSFADLQSRYQKQLVADIVKACRTRGIGKVIYHEPTLPSRPRHWLAANHVPFDWTAFLGRLTFKCEHEGIALEVERLAIPRKEKGEGDGNVRAAV